MSALLQVDDVQVSYGRIEAVRGVSLSLQAGQIVTVIGPNGAGKTTLLGALAGLLAWRGRATYDGVDLHTLDVEDRVERGLCLVPERRELFTDMSVADNLVLGGYVHRRDRAGGRALLGEVFARFPRLQERRAQLAGTLSGGERQMLALGRALMSRPRLLMLDEPSLGLAPRIVDEVFAALALLNRSGLTLLLVEQNARRALEVSSYAYVFDQGVVVHEGPSRELATDPRIVEHYLGQERRLSMPRATPRRN